MSNGTYSSLDSPQAAYSFELGINEAGKVTSGWGDASGSVLHGFVLEL